MTRITFEGKDYRRIGEEVQRRQYREGTGEYWMSLPPGPFRNHILKKIAEAEGQDDIWKGIRMSSSIEKYKRVK